MVGFREKPWVLFGYLSALGLQGGELVWWDVMKVKALA